MTNPAADRANEILRDAGFPEIADYQTMDRHDSRMLQYQARQIAYQEAAVRRELETVRERAERGLRDLDRHQTMNSLGVIQGAALEADRAVALLQERWDTWSMLTATVKATREQEATV